MKIEIARFGHIKVDGNHTALVTIRFMKRNRKKPRRWIGVYNGGLTPSGHDPLLEITNMNSAAVKATIRLIFSTNPEFLSPTYRGFRK